MPRLMFVGRPFYHVLLIALGLVVASRITLYVPSPGRPTIVCATSKQYFQGPKVRSFQHFSTPPRL